MIYLLTKKSHSFIVSAKQERMDSDGLELPISTGTMDLRSAAFIRAIR
jgi:hypothetical protein